MTTENAGLAEQGVVAAGVPVGQAGEPDLTDLLARLDESGAKVSPESMRSIVDRILASGRFCRDTEGGGLLHPKGKIAFRERARRNSMHVSIGEEGISVHIDRVSPLSGDQGDDQECGHCNYSLRRVVAHVGTNLFNRVFHRASGAGVDRRMEIATAGAGAGDGVAPGAAAPGPGCGSSRFARTPYTAIDEAVYLLDTPLEPWTVQVEVRVAGSLDEARFRRALTVALARHPMARARTAGGRPRRSRLEWEITGEPDVDPLRIVDCPDDDALSRARDDFYSLSVPLTTSPPLRIRLARHPQGDVVMLALHHSAIDAVGGLQLLGSIARGYAGTPEPLPGIDPLEVRDFKALFGARGPVERVRRMTTVAREVWGLTRSPSRLAGKGGQNRSGYGIHHRSLTPQQTQSLLGAAAGDHGAEDLLVCALHQSVEAWNLRHGEPAGRITVGIPVDLRPAGWHGQVAGNFLCLVPVSSMPADRLHPAGLLDTVAHRIGHVNRVRSAAALVGLFAVLRRLLPPPVRPAVVIRVTGHPFAPSAVIHHVGAPDGLNFGGELGEVREGWVSPPAMMPEGLSIGVLTAGGQIRLAFRYRLALWGSGEAAEFATGYVHALQALAADPVVQPPGAS